ncbi:MAG: 3-[(3aS,4S,7aS)-7a-methyl-1,5-dioxo-octahydro-1H-inden-4-yl]propanoyl:CoA ligase [Pseudomonadales bacterium]|nr:3-[(3aS,4S,7aS)-7a-methyl-1,5-dioxo-octahydro-1H-inden-4-yl]propanoyl:CoA ligase [Pseudomonadales bacterium]
MTEESGLPQVMPQLIAWAAATHGERTALVEGELRLDFIALAARAREASKAMLAAGIGHGDRVAIWAPNRHEWILAALGAQGIGAVLVPLNTRMKGAEAAYILQRSGARLLFTVTEFAGNRYPEMLAEQQLPALEHIVLFGVAEGGLASWAEFVAGGAAVPDAGVERLAARVAPDDTLDLMFTSGTTGKPKAVMTGHAQNIRCFDTWSRTVGLTADDNYLIINPFFHSFGYKAGWLAAIIRGARILPVVSFDVADVLRRIQFERVSMLPGPPTIYQSLLAHPDRHTYDLSSLRLAVTGAASVPVDLIRRMRSELGFSTVLTAYGLTETCGVVTISGMDDEAELVATTAGRAMPGVEVICANAAGEPVPVGEPGEVWVRGYNVMKGYFDDPAATAETITPDGWLKTGDIGVLNAEGYLRITDRIKDMFIVGGFNCYPAEIENLLCSLDGVAQAAVIGVPDERMGEVAKAFIVPRAGTTLTGQGVIDWCRRNMANYKVPRSVEFVATLPVNAAGKVQKTVLRGQTG